jgi:hypothetical protein
MKKRFINLPVTLLAVATLVITGLQNVSAEVNKDTLWRDAVVTQLDVDFGGTGFHGRWTLQRCPCRDLWARVEQVAPDGVLSGELLMVDGQVLLARGFEGQGADIEPLIQAPTLMLQLAYSILNRSQPKGPFAVDDKQSWDVEEEKIDFKLDTGLATGVFPAPWRVKGSGWKTAAGHRRFELFLEFTSSMPGEPIQTSSISLSGDLDFHAQDFPYPESTDLEGWRIQWISLNEPESEAVAAGTTLKDVRAKANDL